MDDRTLTQTRTVDESIHDPVVCYGISRSMLKGGTNAGGMPVEKNIQPSMTANGCRAVCYESIRSRKSSK